MLNMTQVPWSTDIDTLDYLSKNGNELAKSVLDSDLMKSQRAIRAGLVQVQRVVSKEGKSFIQNFWVKPDQVKKTDMVIRGHQNANTHNKGIVRYAHIKGEPRILKTKKEADSVLKGETFDKWKEGLTKEKLDIIKSYTRSGYKQMNKFLRGKNDEPLSKEVQEELKRKSEILEEIINDYELTEDIQVQRVMYDSDIEMFRKAPNAIFQDDGFISTAAAPGSFQNYAIADEEDRDEDDEDYFEYDTGESLIIINIKVPKGKGVGAWVAPVSAIPTENEFLLNRSTQFQVDEIHYKGDDVYVVDVVAIGRHASPIETTDNVKKSKTKKNIDKFLWRADDLKWVGGVDK